MEMETEQKDIRNLKWIGQLIEKFPFNMMTLKYSLWAIS